MRIYRYIHTYYICIHTCVYKRHIHEIYVTNAALQHEHPHAESLGAWATAAGHGALEAWKALLTPGDSEPDPRAGPKFRFSMSKLLMIETRHDLMCQNSKTKSYGSMNMHKNTYAHGVMQDLNHHQR